MSVSLLGILGLGWDNYRMEGVKTDNKKMDYSSLPAFDCEISYTPRISQQIKQLCSKYTFLDCSELLSALTPSVR